MPSDSVDPNLLTIAPTPDHVVAAAARGRARRPVTVALVVLVGLGFLSRQPIVIVLAIGMFVVAGFMASTAERAYWGRHWHEPRLTMPRHSIRLGETFSAAFRQEAKKAHVATDATIEAALVCTEWVRYTQSSSTRTKTSTVRRVALPVSPLSDDLAVGGNLTVAVPLDLSATFELRNNRVFWTIEIKVVSPKGSDPIHHFPFMVIPEVWDGTVRTAPPTSGGFRPPGPART